MTILLSDQRAASLALSGAANNPLIAWKNLAADATQVSFGFNESAAANAFTGSTFDAWTAESGGSGVVALDLDFGSSTALSFGAIAAHNIGTLGATVELQYSTDNRSSWSDCGAGSVSPSDDQAICWYFTETSAADWRFRISGLTSGQVVEFGVAFLGAAITMPVRIYGDYAPPITPTEVQLQSNVSAGGHLLGSSVVRRGSRAGANFRHVSPEFFRGSDWLDFQRHFNAGGGFFWAWRPTKYGDCYYAWRDGSPLRPENMGIRDLMQAQMSMRFYDEP